MNGSVLTSGGTTVTIIPPPTHAVRKVQLFQVKSYDSAGVRRVVTKGRLTRITTTATFRKITASVLAALQSFHQATVQGGKTLCTWTDWRGNVHTVRLGDSLSWQPRGPLFELDIAFEEDL